MIIELHSDDINNNNNIQDVIKFFPWFSSLVYRKIMQIFLFGYSNNFDFLFYEYKFLFIVS